MVVVNLTRSRAENLGNVARGLEALPPGGTLVVDRRQERRRRQPRPPGRPRPAARRRLRQGARPGVLADPPGHAAGGSRGLGARRRARAATPRASSPRRACSRPTTPTPAAAGSPPPLAGRLSGRVADLGAGWGWLAQAVLAALARRSPSSTSTRPRRWRSTPPAPTSTDPRARFHWTDVTPARPPASPPYDAVIANPPFHQGRAAEPDLGAAFIAAAARILKPSGRLFLVANRQLPYEAVLAIAFRAVGEARRGRRLQGHPRRAAPPRLSPEAPCRMRATNCRPKARLRVNLRMVAALRATITYHEAARGIGLTPPHVIHSLTTLLEELMAEDAAAGRPFIAAMVVSRARDGLPAPASSRPPPGSAAIGATPGARRRWPGTPPSSRWPTPSTPRRRTDRAIRRQRSAVTASRCTYAAAHTPAVSAAFRSAADIPRPGSSHPGLNRPPTEAP